MRGIRRHYDSGDPTLASPDGGMTVVLVVLELPVVNHFREELAAGRLRDATAGMTTAPAGRSST